MATQTKLSLKVRKAPSAIQRDVEVIQRDVDGIHEIVSALRDENASLKKELNDIRVALSALQMSPQHNPPAEGARRAQVPAEQPKEPIARKSPPLPQSQQEMAKPVLAAPSQLLSTMADLHAHLAIAAPPVRNSQPPTHISRLHTNAAPNSKLLSKSEFASMSRPLSTLRDLEHHLGFTQ